MDRKVWNGYGKREVFRNTRGTERGASKRSGKIKSRCKLTIDALLGLLNESLAEGFPGQILGDAIDLGYAHGNDRN